MWLHYTMNAGSNRTVVVDSYREFSDEVYKNYSEESWKEEVENICENEHSGWSYERGFSYSFEIVEYPPKEWIEKAIKSKESRLESLKEEIEKLKILISK